MPVTHGVTGSSPVRTAFFMKQNKKSPEVQYLGLSLSNTTPKSSGIMGQHKNLRDSLIKHKFLLVWRERKLWPSLLWTASPQEFLKKMFHLSGYMIKDYHIACYVMKDKSVYFSFLSLRKAIKSSQPNDFSISAKRFSVLLRTKWSVTEGYLKHPSACNINITSNLSWNLKDETSFCKLPV